MLMNALRPLLAAILLAAVVPGAQATDPSLTGGGPWLRYSPFFMCGPGDPENFLYRGVRNADGTRTGDQMSLIGKLASTGANGIYMQIIRSDGGDGDPTHNPFVDSDPALGLDEDILDQWGSWFTAMDEAGIVIYLFIYDDGVDVWGGGDAVTPEEQAFLEAIVNRFEHHDRLVWAIAEEYDVALSAERVSNIAAVIRTADGRRHPIAVHKTTGLSFSEFAGDSNIDQFAIQFDAPDAEGYHSAMMTAWTDAAGRYSLNMAEGHPDAFGEDARLRAWAVAMGGSTVMHLRWDIASTPVADLEDCGRLVSFMESTDFDRMAPRDDLTFGGTEYVLASTDSYILYASELFGEIGVKAIAAGTYDLRWLDIPTGITVEDIGLVVAGGDVSWIPPAAIGGEVAVWVRPSSGFSASPPDPDPDPSDNSAPVAAFTATPPSGTAPLDVAFDASSSSDDDGTIVSYGWDFGDGATGTGPAVQHTYGVGVHIASLTVTDDEGATGVKTAPISASGSTGYMLQVSVTPGRANPVPLEGRAVSGPIYVFTSPDQGVSATPQNRVKFWLDDPTMHGAPRRQERNPPYDFAGGSSAIASPFDASTIAAGAHTISAALPLSDGTTAIVHATFTVQ